MFFKSEQTQLYKGRKNKMSPLINYCDAKLWELTWTENPPRICKLLFIFITSWCGEKPLWFARSICEFHGELLLELSWLHGPNAEVFDRSFMIGLNSEGWDRSLLIGWTAAGLFAWYFAYHCEDKLWFTIVKSFLIHLSRLLNIFNWFRGTRATPFLQKMIRFYSTALL